MEIVLSNITLYKIIGVEKGHSLGQLMGFLPESSDNRCCLCQQYCDVAV